MEASIPTHYRAPPTRSTRAMRVMQISESKLAFGRCELQISFKSFFSSLLLQQCRRKVCNLCFQRTSLGFLSVTNWRERLAWNGFRFS